MFAFRLAFRLGRLDVDNLLSEIDAKDLTEWKIAWKLGLEPDGWQQMAELASMLTNQMILLRNQMAAEKTTIDDLVKPVDFLPAEMRPDYGNDR